MLTGHISELGAGGRGHFCISKYVRLVYVSMSIEFGFTCKVQSVAINISSQCEFPSTSVHFSVCKKINYFISVHAI